MRRLLYGYYVPPDRLYETGEEPGLFAEGEEEKVAKLRKMLGSAQSPGIVRLMRLIETQSVQTLAGWAADCAAGRYLPLYAAGRPEDTRLSEAVEAVRVCLKTGGKSASVRAELNAAAQAAKEETDPVLQAAARAVATACAAIRTPTNALGFAFYGAAARAYSELGTNAPAAGYDALAEREFAELYALLEKAAVENEPNPAKIDWNC